MYLQQTWKVLGFSLLSLCTIEVYADQCFLANTKSKVQQCDVAEGFAAGSRQVTLDFSGKHYSIVYESCQNELTEGGCSKANIQTNQGAIQKVTSYLRDGVSQKVITEENWSSTAFDCVRNLNNTLNICWKSSILSAE